ncbi:hypothetical protein [Microseira sp. BLCC-F43]|jgi:hypothetical protein|uniref:hypothetical protein n=1 Tax=Microseira sp. BLCC-F43 TaxID=3153602 RepID=UPI0035B7F3D2
MSVLNVGSTFSGIMRRLETTTSVSGMVNVTATSTLVRAANNDRTVLYVINTGANWVTVDHRNDPVFGSGILLSPSGGTYQIESGNLDKRLVYAICGAGLTSTLSFYEGSGEEVLQT